MPSPALAPKIPSSTSHAKLHKRNNPSHSLPQPPSRPKAAHMACGEPSSTPTLSSSVPKIRPYLRKMSTTKDDQGKIDLSKSTSENHRLADLATQDVAPKYVGDVSFSHTKRGQQHARNISGSSHVSAGSAGLKSAFVHPMAKTPRPYTPPAGRSHAASLPDEEANEGDDVVEEEFRLANSFKSRRSMSISLTPLAIPTPLSQSHTTSDLVLVPPLMTTSHSNLSLGSNNSDRSSNAKKTRPRRNTSPSSRTSFDKAFAFVSRRPDAEPMPRDEAIREARRKFEEKEASKNRKYEKEASRRQQSEAKKHERQRQKSDVHVTLPAQDKSSADNTVEKKRRKSSAGITRAEKEMAPSHAASLLFFRRFLSSS